MSEKYRDMRHIYYDNPADIETVNRMLETRYNSEAAIRLPFDVGGYPAFVMLNIELVSLITSIYQASMRLERLSASVPPEAIQQFRRKMIIEEIQQTNEVENVHSTRKEIRAAMAAMDEGRRSKRFDGMVRKYSMIMGESVIPLRSSTDIRSLYDEFILDEVLREEPDNKPDGVLFRKGAASVYSGWDQKLHEGLAPEEKIIDTMEKALAVLNDEAIDILIRVASFHYMFAYVHPFYDGNGRMTRFISSYMLSKVFDKSACLRIAYVIKDHRSQYYRMFKAANDKHNRGEITSFVMDFLRFFAQAIEDSHRSLEEKKGCYKRYRCLLEQAVAHRCPDMNPNYQSLLVVMLQEELFGYPRFSVKKMAAILECSERTVRTLLEKCGPILRHENEGRKYWWHIDLDALEHE